MLCLLLPIIVAGTAKAQTGIMALAMVEASEEYQKMVGGTIVPFNETDDAVAGFYMPFDFNIDGLAMANGVSTFYVNTNGYIDFNTSSTTSRTTLFYDYSISVFAATQDLSIGQVTVGILGSAPNRVLIIQYKKINHLNTTKDVVVLRSGDITVTRTINMIH